LFPGCILIILTSWKFAHTSYAMLEGSPDPGGIPLRFIVKSLIPVGFSLLCLQGLSLGIHSLLQILGIETVKEESA
jgi:TRAP-type mannitol/chloroaromatic compound transport system permease small subunit